MISQIHNYTKTSHFKHNELVIKNIIYGNAARLLQREVDGKKLHQWKVYLKSCENDDMSAFIRKVVFKINNKQRPSTHVIMRPPFYITERGHIECPIEIIVYFQDIFTAPISMIHHLRLHAPSTDRCYDIDYSVGIDGYIMSETLDKLIFKNPSHLMKHYLRCVRPLQPKTEVAKRIYNQSATTADDQENNSASHSPWGSVKGTRPAMTSVRVRFAKKYGKLMREVD